MAYRPRGNVRLEHQRCIGSHSGLWIGSPPGLDVVNGVHASGRDWFPFAADQHGQGMEDVALLEALDARGESTITPS